jgi:sulfite reductase alpha subunit-like flavoprotein
LKLAEKLKKRVKELPGNFQVDIKILNTLDIRNIDLSDPILMVASTTGDGRFPANGADLEAAMEDMAQEYRGAFPVKFSIFGVGDSAYPTFNAASTKLYNFMKAVGGVPIATGLVKGNTAVEALPMKSFNRWWSAVRGSLTGEESTIETGEDEYLEQQRMLEMFKTGRLLDKSASETWEGRIIMITMDLGDVDYVEMSHLRLLPWNAPAQVSRALAALGVSDPGQLIPLNDTGLQPLSYADFFRRFADLEGSFKDFRWLSEVSSDVDVCDRSGSVLEVLERLPMLQDISDDLRMKICLNMPLLRPRSFSVASSAQYIGRGKVEIMVRLHRGGRFSDKFLAAIAPGSPIQYSPVSIIPGRDLLSSDKPVVAICTGTGFAPVRSLLQQRIHSVKEAKARGCPFHFQKPPISLFLGFKAHDQPLFQDILSTAVRYGLIDMLFQVPSNKQKRRVQDYVQEHKESVLVRIRDGSVYVCGAKAMVSDTAMRLSDMIGGDARQRLGSRYVEEIF